MARVRATYRIQLNSGFGLGRVRELVPYLEQLGVSHIYLSPILRARAGSAHGYDVVDPNALNPELGTEAELQELAATLEAASMGAVLDIVPNHMATGAENAYWMDVLKHGRCSRYADWFDIDWGPPRARRPYRIFLPVLGDRLARVLQRGELELAYRDGEFRLEYYDQIFPIDPATVPAVLDAGGSAPATLEEIVSALRSLPPRHGPAARDGAEREAWASAALAELAAHVAASAAAADHIESAIAAFDLEVPGGAKRLRRLLAAQAYRLAYWRRAAREINYRRFFTISHLVALRMEHPAVFRTTHERVLGWVEAGTIDGLRIDHVDGLLDPGEYLERLRAAVTERRGATGDWETPIFVEKILARDERLPDEWPVAGTTGYAFLNEVEDLFIDPAGAERIEASYRTFARREIDFRAVARRGKRLVLDRALGAEVQRLTRHLHEIVSGADGPARRALAEAIIEAMVCLSVYRTYMNPRRPDHRPSDRARLVRALESAGQRGRAPVAALDALRRALLLQEPAGQPESERARRLAFTQRFQQTCGAVAAKGVEDTAFYVHVPLLSRNEVGGEPDADLGDAVGTLHEANRRRAMHWPAAMLGASTHDTKRSADVRARIDVLSEVADEWSDRVRCWHRWNRDHRGQSGQRAVPDRNTEYHYYQTLVGVWPLGGVGADVNVEPVAGSDLFRQRLESYMEKAVREAKQHSNWIEPNVEFEDALRRFVRLTLSPETSGRFLADLEGFVQRVARPGLWNSLARTAVQLTAPGTPDCYQGDELWNFSLVDPDNRRPVDFERRRQALTGLAEAWSTGTEPDRRELARRLAEHPEDGRIKMFVIWRALQTRRSEPDLFGGGDYEPIYATGPAADHVFAFARRHRDRRALTVVPRRVASLVGDGATAPTGPGIWRETELKLPVSLSGVTWKHAFTDATVSTLAAPSPHLPLADVFSELPAAILLAAE
ncbi:MAG: malto-oligosyltrehalose synthase [Gemmatimonadetes bacterium]|uniref:Malto-oligosyltrehalose synthase n=1 Tax=Candidatus Kutchimonas denitrificans TaxID=3056748 RepID=A0AAE4ZAI2_9BACT|nr:malto-oligosyltrehalose synthase [Gemmatimonadota bacterium]NIR76613.1 malto-oligosyltrehalose synthase [Candidatus Kutchimonas denitrificans]NIS03382.1 malto-oligosyltrehalose synthase [Gemmatimonadota bacterium]NIT69243.1 malto-oligosyltrehalose synthase [Gemmatimonadota bacterium]NIU54715.1 malto-oligosyltrehalose synthase [Gemmatimonadota bacterium]